MVRTLSPPIDPAEEEYVYFDFAPALSPGVAIGFIVEVLCAVVSGADPSPQSRLLGSPSIIRSPSTDAPATAVRQKVGGMLAGTLYQIQCVVNCSDDEVLSWRVNLPCSQPPAR